MKSNHVSRLGCRDRLLWPTRSIPQLSHENSTIKIPMNPTPSIVRILLNLLFTDGPAVHWNNNLSYWNWCEMGCRRLWSHLQESKWEHHIISKCRELITHWRGFVSRKDGSSSCTASGTWKGTNVSVLCVALRKLSTVTLRLPSLRLFRAFPSAVRQMPGCNWQRRGTASTLPK